MAHAHNTIHIATGRADSSCLLNYEYEKPITLNMKMYNVMKNIILYPIHTTTPIEYHY